MLLALPACRITQHSPSSTLKPLVSQQGIGGRDGKATSPISDCNCHPKQVKQGHVCKCYCQSMSHSVSEDALAKYKALIVRKAKPAQKEAAVSSTTAIAAFTFRTKTPRKSPANVEKAASRRCRAKI